MANMNAYIISWLANMHELLWQYLVYEMKNENEKNYSSVIEYDCIHFRKLGEITRIAWYSRRLSIRSRLLMRGTGSIPLVVLLYIGSISSEDETNRHISELHVQLVQM